MGDQQDTTNGAAGADEQAPAVPQSAPAGEPEAPVAPPAEGDRPTEPPAEAEAPAQDAADAATPAAPEGAAPPPSEHAPPAVGPKILGVAEEPKKVPVVKKRLQEKPKRDPLPWPELRAAVAATRDDVDVAELKELFRAFPVKVREEVTENVRGFKKGARRPVSQHAAKQLARAVHTARRQKRNAHPSGEVGEALGQAMAAELLASLEPERAAEVILPKRDLLEREARQARRRARDEEDKRRDEFRRKRREDAKQTRGQTSFGSFSGAKIKGLDELAAMFADAPRDPEPEAEAPVADAPTAETPAPGVDGTPATEQAPADAPSVEEPAEPGDRPTEPAPEEEAPGGGSAAGAAGEGPTEIATEPAGDGAPGGEAPPLNADEPPAS